MQNIFIDGLGNIALQDGVVRIELVTTKQVDDRKQEMKSVGNVAMSLPALVRVHDQLSKAIEGLVERGILSEQTTDNAGSLPASQ
jgi:hypothetical protein